MPNDRLLSGANISHPLPNRPRGYAPAGDGPRDPAARLDYMLQRLQEATHTDHGDREDYNLFLRLHNRQNDLRDIGLADGREPLPFPGPMSPAVDKNPWTEDPVDRAASMHMQQQRYRNLIPTEIEQRRAAGVTDPFELDPRNAENPFWWEPR